MDFFKKKPDPISDHAKALNSEIASLESQIKKLTSELEQTPPQARLGSRPATSVHPPANNSSSSPEPAASEPVFEAVDHRRLKTQTELTAAPAHYNDLGVRKFDLLAAWQRWREKWRGPPPSNPKLVNYLAAGSIQGLPPLRYEKRVARYRLVLWCLLLFLVLWIVSEIIWRR